MRLIHKHTPRSIQTAPIAILALALTTALNASAHGQITQRWLTQWGTSGDDLGNAVAVDATGKTWVVGTTNGILSGTNTGFDDIFLTPLSTTGVVGTSFQRGGIGYSEGVAAAVVGGSNIFAIGYTNTTTPWDGAAAIGGADAVAVGYNIAGVHTSTTRFGSTVDDVPQGAAGNATNLLVTGFTDGNIDGQTPIGAKDAFLSKRTNTGALVWTREVGSVGDDVGVAAAFDSAGNAYMTGYTAGSFSGFTNLGNDDLFLARYDAVGTQTLLKQWGTSGEEAAYGMKVDGSGNIYVTGYTTGDLGGQTNSGNIDAFLTKLDSSGSVLWTRLLGDADNELAFGLALDTAGNVWIGGYSDGDFAGNTGNGGADAFAAAYDSAGNLLGTRFWGSYGAADWITGLAASPDGSVSVSGLTSDTVGAQSAGGWDAWAASLTIVPEPTTAALLFTNTALFSLRRRRD